MNKITWTKTTDYRGFNVYTGNGYTIKKSDRSFGLYHKGVRIGTFANLNDAKQWVESK